MKLAKPMVQAAKPTSECMIATSSGIWVILTMRAAKRPMVPPTSMAPMIQGRPWGRTSCQVSVRPMPTSTMRVPKMVASTAIAMPTMPNQLPRREVSGLESPPSDRMNRMIAAI